MKWIMEIFNDAVLPALGVVLAYSASRLGAFLGRFFREKWKDDSARAVAMTCVRAVEQMYRDLHGEEKLNKALSMGEEMLSQKGIRISSEEMRALLEEALSRAKGTFDGV